MSYSCRTPILAPSCSSVSATHPTCCPYHTHTHHVESNRETHTRYMPYTCTLIISPSHTHLLGRSLFTTHASTPTCVLTSSRIHHVEITDNRYHVRVDSVRMHTNTHTHRCYHPYRHRHHYHHYYLHRPCAHGVCMVTAMMTATMTTTMRMTRVTAVMMFVHTCTIGTHACTCTCTCTHVHATRGEEEERGGEQQQHQPPPPSPPPATGTAAVMTATLDSLASVQQQQQRRGGEEERGGGDEEGGEDLSQARGHGGRAGPPAGEPVLLLLLLVYSCQQWWWQGRAAVVQRRGGQQHWSAAAVLDSVEGSRVVWYRGSSRTARLSGRDLAESARPGPFAAGVPKPKSLLDREKNEKEESSAKRSHSSTPGSNCPGPYFPTPRSRQRGDIRRSCFHQNDQRLKLYQTD